MYHWIIRFSDGSSYKVHHTTNIQEAIKIALLNKNKSSWDIVGAERSGI